MVWVNVVIPNKSCTIHTVSHCVYVDRKEVTPFKGVESLKREEEGTFHWNVS